MLLTARWDETTPRPRAASLHAARLKADRSAATRPISVHRFDREKKEISFYSEVRGSTQKRLRCGPGTPPADGPLSGRGFPVDGTLGGAVALVGGGTAPRRCCSLRQSHAQGGRGPYAGWDGFTALTRSALRAARYTSPRDSGRHGHHGFGILTLDPAKYNAVYLRAGDRDGKGGQKCVCVRACAYMEQGGWQMACGVGVSGLHLQEQNGGAQGLSARMGRCLKGACCMSLTDVTLCGKTLCSFSGQRRVRQSSASAASTRAS